MRPYDRQEAKDMVAQYTNKSVRTPGIRGSSIDDDVYTGTLSTTGGPAIWPGGSSKPAYNFGVLMLNKSGVHVMGTVDGSGMSIVYPDMAVNLIDSHVDLIARHTGTIAKDIREGDLDAITMFVEGILSILARSQKSDGSIPPVVHQGQQTPELYQTFAHLHNAGVADLADQIPGTGNILKTLTVAHRMHERMESARKSAERNPFLLVPRAPSEYAEPDLYCDGVEVLGVNQHGEFDVVIGHYGDDGVEFRSKSSGRHFHLVEFFWLPPKLEKEEPKYQSLDDHPF